MQFTERQDLKPLKETRKINVTPIGQTHQAEDSFHTSNRIKAMDSSAPSELYFCIDT